MMYTLHVHVRAFPTCQDSSAGRACAILACTHVHTYMCIYIHVHVYMYMYVVWLQYIHVHVCVFTLLSFLACVARVCASWYIVDDPLDFRLDRTTCTQCIYTCTYMYVYNLTVILKNVLPQMGLELNTQCSYIQSITCIIA